MAIAVMKKFQILGLKKEIDLLSGEILKNGQIELIRRKELRQVFRPYKGDNPYKPLLNNIIEIMRALNISTDFSSVDLNQLQGVKPEEIRRFIKPLKEQLNKYQRLTKRLSREESRLKNLKRHVYLMRKMDIDLEELRKLSHISLIFGSLGKEGYQRLIDTINDLPILVLEVNRDEDKVWFFTFTKKVNEKKALDILKSVYFERINLPPRVTGQPRDILKRADYRLERIALIREQLALEYKKMAHRYEGELKKYFQQLAVLNKIKDIDNQYYSETGHIFMLSGWITAREEKRFLESLQARFPDVIYTSQEVARDGVEEPPVIMENPEWLRPFSSLVKLYGLPSYGELDPSLFLAITYILMFGMMFGDLGQGFIFALTGWLIFRNKLKIASQEVAYLLLSLGLSSMLFGVVYGSVFGIETLLPALIIRPMESIMTWLGFTVVFGIILIITSMVFNLVNAYRRNNLASGLFSGNGLTGLFFYLFLLASLASRVLRGRFIFPGAITVCLLLLPLLVIFFREPLGNLLKGKGPVISGKPVDYFLESAFELFDTVLGYLSNTISFVRIGAFTLNHAGLSMAVMILSEMMRNNLGSLLVLVAGNLVIIGLEGLVVGIQILRLEFFELFGKFYQGQGKEFKPVRVNEFD